MKKLIALILILVLALSSCEYINPQSNPADNTPTADSSQNNNNADTTPDSTPDGDSDCAHAVITIKDKKTATCTESGYTGDKVCYACGLVVQLGEQTATVPHNYVGGVCKSCGDVESTGGNTECQTHKDADDNGLCDVCRVNVLVWYNFYSVNDLHGKFSDTDSQPGVDELTTYLKEAKSNGNTILLSAGDMWQGSSESNLTKGNLITDWMNHLGFVSMTIGNHEFDWTDEYIRANLAIADFPFLAINIYDKYTEERMDYCEPSTVVDMGGFQIGIIGAIGDCYTSISGESIGDVYFKVGNELTELVKAESERLRAEEGADLIVYCIHSGSDYDERLSDGYIDLVFEGHSHQTYVNYDSYGVVHLQGGGENRGISYARVSINSANGNTKVATAKTISASVYSSYEPDSIVDELLEKYKDVISKAFEVLGYNSTYRDDSEIEALVAKLYYQYGIEKWGDEYDIVLGGGSINTRSPYNIYQGNVQYSHLQSILPFDNEITLCSVSGRDLLNKFINSNYSAYYEIDPSTIDPYATYYIVTDTWSSGWAPNNLTEIARLGPNIFARDLLAEYVKEGNWE